MRGIARLIALLTALLIALPAAGQTFPKFTGLVVDAANVLPQATRDDLTRKLEALQHDTNRQLVVATIPDLQGYPIDDYAYKLGRAWGVGLKGVDNGVILLIAPNEPAGQRGPWITVGYGLEPIVTDALAHQIAMNLMTPMLKRGDIAGAMEAGTDALVTQLRASPDEAKARTDAAVKTFNRSHARQGGPDGFPWALGFWLMVLGFVVLSRFRRRHGARYGGSGWPIFFWGGGGGWGGPPGDGGGGLGGGSGSDGGWGGGGFTGGGGGSFGGGGAGGGW